MQQDKLTLKQYLQNRHNTILDEGIQLSKIGYSETQLTKDLAKYNTHNNL